MIEKKTFNLWAVVVSLAFFTPSISHAKSVFAVAGHANGKIKAYLIDPNGTGESTIAYQATIPNPMEDATGLCLWPEKDRVFVTYEGVGTISWASIKNLNRDPEKDDYETSISEGNGLGGMAVDESMSRLYVIARGTNHLYAFDYDEADNTLTPIPLSETTMHRTLPEVVTTSYGAFDIAIDPEGSMLMDILPVGRIYVSDNTQNVQYYNLATWEHEGTITFEQSVIGIGLDTTRGYIYGGNFNGGSGNSFLMRASINDPNDYVEKNMGTSIMDISVDEETGVLYLTSYRYYQGRSGAVEVYDPTNWTDSNPDSLVQIDIKNDSDFGGSNNGPAGIAVGPSYKPPHDMYIAKIDDVADPNGYVLPGNVYHYSIVFRPGPSDESNVVITDTLPQGVDFISASPDTGVYLPKPEHKYVWEIGNVSGYDPNVPGDPNYYFSLTVQVNNLAEPKGVLYNKVSAESDQAYADTFETTRIGCFGGDIIYVDWNAPSPHTGTSWQTAYLDLNSALVRAKLGCTTEIWVADGTYIPGGDYSDFFDVGAGIVVRGGYAGYGAADPNERDWKQYRTVLSGSGINQTVVKLGNGCLLDGVTVTGSSSAAESRGIYILNANAEIINVVVRDNLARGIRSESANLNVRSCEIFHNGTQGIYQTGSGKLLQVVSCKIFANQRDGVYTESSTSTVLNSLIYQNGSGTTYYGINLVSPYTGPTIRNNTIVHNFNEGIRFVGSNVPSVRNNILYYNNTQEQGSPQLAGISITYNCCIYDPNSQSSSPDGRGNIKCEPDFVYDAEPHGFYHIKYESYCRNGGSNTGVGVGELDMDGEPRIADDSYDIVDIGADEVDCWDTFNIRDWTYDGVINLDEFSIFSRAFMSWDPNSPLCDPNNPGYVSDPNAPGYISETAKANWNPICDFNDDTTVDLADFITFCEDWCWVACWRLDLLELMEQEQQMMMGGENQMQSLDAGLMETEALQTISEPEMIQSEPTVEEQILQLQDAITFLEQIWLEEPDIQQEISAEDWQAFMDSVYQNLTELQAENANDEL
ncbi:MAG: right-handed parallel beta-helix repeat-containing protein [Planctomycetaceae bacterium]|nr:right-handed parallel beta-helix repeat-containing protein [Planctomycetaceae bacterium]